MSREFVRESFSVYFKKFKLFLVPGLLCFLCMLVAVKLVTVDLSNFNVLLIGCATELVMSFVFLIPCIAIYCEKKPLGAIRENAKALLAVVAVKAIVMTLVAYVSRVVSLSEIALVRSFFSLVVGVVQTSLAILLTAVFHPIIKDGLSAISAARDVLKAFFGDIGESIVLCVKTAFWLFIYCILPMIIYLLLFTVMLIIFANDLPEGVILAIALSGAAATIVPLYTVQYVVYCKCYETLKK